MLVKDISRRLASSEIFRWWRAKVRHHLGDVVVCVIVSIFIERVERMLVLEEIPYLALVSTFASQLCMTIEEARPLRTRGAEKAAVHLP